MNAEEYKLYESMRDRITDLAKSYRVLNDNHSRLELEFVEFKAMVNTSITILKYFVSPAVAFTLLIQLGKLVGVIK